uniref:Uncharacterized protein n=1 Tax=Aegilops tauschii subsp. strangulata TaxID=200361 RepID=A0A453AMB6_AEGTS
ESEDLKAGEKKTKDPVEKEIEDLKAKKIPRHEERSPSGTALLLAWSESPQPLMQERKDMHTLMRLVCWEVWKH